MFKKRWSNASMIFILIMNNAFLVLMYFILNHTVSEKKEQYIYLLERNSEIYAGIALPNDTLVGNYQEDRKKAKAFLIDNTDSNLWKHFHTEVLLTHKVYVFKMLTEESTAFE